MEVDMQGVGVLRGSATWSDKEVMRLTWWPREVMELLGRLLGDMMDNYIDENLRVVINGEAQLHALVDGKKIIITESSVRRDLQLADEEGVDCLPNSIIFEQLALMDPKTTAWNELISTMASAIIYEAVHKELGDSLVGLPYCFLARSRAGTKNHGEYNAQTRFESVSKHSNDSLLAKGNTLQSDEDIIKLDELMILCTTLQNKVLDLEQTKTSQQNEIASLKRRVKKLEKKDRSRTHKLKKLYKVAFTAKVESSDDEESLGEDASK
ncbi:hypothetical protein Tco_1541940 [Tanacetum coccineum]